MLLLQSRDNITIVACVTGVPLCVQYLNLMLTPTLSRCSIPVPVSQGGNGRSESPKVLSIGLELSQ